MSKNGFDFSGFFRAPVDVEYKPDPSIPDGEGVMLNLNLDLITLERMEAIEELFNTAFREAQGSSSTSESGEDELPVKEPSKISLYAYEKAMFDVRVTLMAGEKGADDPKKRFIGSWGVVKDGKPLPVAYESFTDMPVAAVTHLFNFITGKANTPTKDEKKESEAI